MSREVVFDIETQNTFEEVGAGNHRGLKISVVVAYCYEDDSFHTFREENLKDLWPILERAERLIGYNSKFFDVPVLQNYYTGDLSKIPHLDLLEEIRRSAGFRPKLDDIAKATLGTQKSGHGLQAVEWFKAGEWDKIEKYCIDDVRITRDVYEYGKTHKQIFYSDVAGGMKPIPVKFGLERVVVNAEGAPAGTGMNLTLPF
jgi:DEAD/DEAH box helicase domain-containing protein